MAQNTGINSLDAGAPDLRLTGDQRPQEDNIRLKIKQIAEQSGHAESFPATDSDFAALAQLSDSPDDFPSTDYDFKVILKIAKETNFTAPEKSKAETYANYMAKGGRTGYANGNNDDEEETHRASALAALYNQRRMGADEGGLMNLGGMEKDYRQEGGFVPIGGKEKADDVPARLSKNEFVFTADAVRAAGGGDIDAGAEVMENVMENLEAGGKVSEDSQGLEGAREMFANAQQLEKRII